MLNIDESGNIHDRIAEMVDFFCKGNKAAFGRGADIQSGVLAGIISGRKNKPSFDVLQKLLTGYPSVNPVWLLFGRGPMMQWKSEELRDAPRTTKEQTEDDIRLHTLKYIATDEWFKLNVDAIEIKAEELRSTQMYVVADKDPASHKYSRLAKRLSISEENAWKLVHEGRIRATKIDEEEGYRISEQAVKEFLGEA
jgi:excisionase family DNA binding protein